MLNVFDEWVFPAAVELGQNVVQVRELGNIVVPMADLNPLDIPLKHNIFRLDGQNKLQKRLLVLIHCSIVKELIEGIGAQMQLEVVLDKLEDILNSF